MPLLIRAMAPKFAVFTKGSKLPLKKGFKNMFELLQSCAQPSKYCLNQRVDTLLREVTIDMEIFTSHLMGAYC